MKQQKIYGTTLTMEPPKHNEDYEKGIIKSCLSASFHESETRDYALKRLKPEYFYNPKYGDCFHAICDMVNGTYGRPVPFPTEIEFAQYAYDNAARYTTFRNLQQGENVKSLQTFQLLAFDIMESGLLDVNGEYAVSEIIRMYRTREIYTLAVRLENITGEWFEEPAERKEIRERLEMLETLGNEVYDDMFTPSTYSATSSALQHQGAGLHTGYMLTKKPQKGPRIEREFTIPPKQITVIAAATGHGKTTFCYNLALRLIEHNKRPDGNPLKVVYLSYEEPAHNIEPKIINVMTGVNLADDNRAAIVHDLATNGTGDTIKSELTGHYIDAVRKYYEMARAQTLTVKYCNFDASELCGLIREFRRRDLADVVIIDYVQLIEKESSKAHGRNRPDELKEICADLRNVATDENFGLPVIVASQFNRDVQKSNDPRTMDKTNIGESANIEHVANVILGLWNCQETNPEKYMKTIDGKLTDQLTPDGERLANYQHTKNIDAPFIYARLLKSRDGVNGLNMTLNYYGNCGRIDNTGDPSPNQRAGYDRDELTEPYNELYKAGKYHKSAPAAAPADGDDSGEQQSVMQELPF